jgi:hypothetical protein
METLRSWRSEAAFGEENWNPRMFTITGARSASPSGTNRPESSKRPAITSVVAPAATRSPSPSARRRARPAAPRLGAAAGTGETCRDQRRKREPKADSRDRANPSSDGIHGVSSSLCVKVRYARSSLAGRGAMLTVAIAAAAMCLVFMIASTTPFVGALSPRNLGAGPVRRRGSFGGSAPNRRQRTVKCGVESGASTAKELPAGNAIARGDLREQLLEREDCPPSSRRRDEQRRCA